MYAAAATLHDDKNVREYTTISFTLAPSQLFEVLTFFFHLQYMYIYILFFIECRICAVCLDVYINNVSQ